MFINWSFSLDMTDKTNFWDILWRSETCCPKIMRRYFWQHASMSAVSHTISDRGISWADSELLKGKLTLTSRLRSMIIKQANLIQCGNVDNLYNSASLRKINEYLLVESIDIHQCSWERSKWQPHISEHIKVSCFTNLNPMILWQLIITQSSRKMKRSFLIISMGVKYAKPSYIILDVKAGSS